MRLLDEMRDVMRRRHYSIRTERAYCDWVRRYILHFCMKSHNDLNDGEKSGRLSDISGTCKKCGSFNLKIRH